MKEYKLGDKVLIAVPWYEDAIRCYMQGDRWLYFTLKGAVNHGIELPPGSYSILARGREVTDSQWQDLLEEEMNLDIHDNEWWRNYEDDYKPFRSATESGLSWLRSQGINENDLLIIKM